jgi:hypothetical protein
MMLKPIAENNKACRAFDFTKTETPAKAAEIKANREKLDKAIFKSCELLGIESFVGLPDEWWDYRYPSSISTEYEPLREKDLPQRMRLTPGSEVHPEVAFNDERYQRNLSDITNAANEGFEQYRQSKNANVKIVNQRTL